MSFERRYPVKRTTYMQTVGKLLPRRISQILRELGYTVWTNPDQENGIDLKVWCDNTLILVGEILNWSIKSVLSEERMESMISNLNEFNCNKVLIYTSLENNSLSRFIENGIDTLEIGFQILPAYYHFFSRRGQTERRVVDCYLARKQIRNKLIEYFSKHLQHIRSI